MSEMRISDEPSDFRGARKCANIKPARGTGCRTNIDFEKFSPEDKENYLDLARKLLNR